MNADTAFNFLVSIAVSVLTLIVVTVVTNDIGRGLFWCGVVALGCGFVGAHNWERGDWW